MVFQFSAKSEENFSMNQEKKSFSASRNSSLRVTLLLSGQDNQKKINSFLRWIASDCIQKKFAATVPVNVGPCSLQVKKFSGFKLVF